MTAVAGQRSSGDSWSSGRFLSVVIPTKDEEEGIRRCLEEAYETLERMNLDGEVIVSDGSSDSTPRIAREMGATVLTPDKPGYGYAYTYAFEEARGDIIAMGDGDGTYDFTELPEMVAAVDQGADIVLGSRFRGDIEPGAMPWLHRYVGNPVLTWFLNYFYGTDVSDAHTGFRVFTREVLEALDLRSDGMEFASEMIVEARAEGFNIVEVPISYRERVGEPTLQSFSDGWRHLKFILVNTPEDLFTVPGLTLLGFGAILMSVAAIDVRLFGQEFEINSMIAGSLLTVVGWQVVALGVFSGYAEESIKPRRGRFGRLVRTAFSLERGILLGSLILLPGLLVALVQLTVWTASGFERLPTPAYGLLAATSIALGVQTVFLSLFVSILAERG